MLTTDRLQRVILEELARGELRPLALLVAVRRGWGTLAPFKGDLASGVTQALRRLVASKTVVETGGVFKLAAA